MIKKADKIGSGSYGEVYRGWWQGKQPVAVKELTGTLTTDAEKDLYREAGIMAYMAKVSTRTLSYGAAVRAGRGKTELRTDHGICAQRHPV